MLFSRTLLTHPLATKVPNTLPAIATTPTVATQLRNNQLSHQSPIAACSDRITIPTATAAMLPTNNPTSENQSVTIRRFRLGFGLQTTCGDS
jgi:hypothetical protein